MVAKNKPKSLREVLEGSDADAVVVEAFLLFVEELEKSPPEYLLDSLAAIMEALRNKGLTGGYAIIKLGIKAYLKELADRRS